MGDTAGAASRKHRVTIIDVAERAGVAISSVSSALNNRPGVSEQTRRRILDAAAELGFTPSLRAKSLSGKRAYAVGLVVQRDPDVLELDPFFGAFIGGVEAHLHDRDFALVLQMSSSPTQTLDRYRRLAADRRVDGVFLNELEVDDPRIDLVRELGLPAVAVNPGPGCPVPAVRQDYSGAIRALFGYLAGAGHRRVAHVSGPMNYLHSVQRVEAWRAAAREFGLDEGVCVSGDFTYEGGLAAAGAIAADAGSTAVFCANDLSALGLIAGLGRRGVAVPDQRSVAGFDGIQLGTYFHPALTTVQTSPRGIGYEAARLLLEVIDAAVDTAAAPGAVRDTAVAPAELVLRGSTARV